MECIYVFITIIILTLLIYFLFIRQNSNTFKIILVFLTTIFIFNFFDNTKSFERITFFDFSKKFCVELWSGKAEEPIYENNKESLPIQLSSINM